MTGCTVCHRSWSFSRIWFHYQLHSSADYCSLYEIRIRCNCHRARYHSTVDGRHL